MCRAEAMPLPEKVSLRQWIYHHQPKRAEQLEVLRVVRHERMPFGKALRGQQGIFIRQCPADGFQERKIPLPLQQAIGVHRLDRLGKIDFSSSDALSQQRLVTGIRQFHPIAHFGNRH
jgi:hypothetical protein